MTAEEFRDVLDDEIAESMKDPAYRAARQALDFSDFLAARLAEDAADPGCEGYGEYASCHRLSERIGLEVAAKRLIVGLHAGTDDSTSYGSASGVACKACVKFHADMDCENEPWPCATLRALALPYADHGDYQKAWRP